MEGHVRAQAPRSPAGALLLVAVGAAAVGEVLANEAAAVRNVRAVRVAAWDRRTRVRIDPSLDNSGDHRVRAVRAWRGTQRGVALDRLLRGQRVHVVKSDLQGRDHIALRGLTATLRRWRPALHHRRPHRTPRRPNSRAACRPRAPSST